MIEFMIILLLLLSALKVFGIGWMIYNHRRTQGILNQIDKDHKEVMDWFEQLKAEKRTKE